jgi:Immunoglobulin I-set domain/Immunoglobulin domain
MQPATRCVDFSFCVRFRGWFARQPSLVALGSNSGLRQSSTHQGLSPSAASLLGNAGLQLLTVLAVAFTLLSLSGCAGGFQGYKPMAPTVTQPASVTVPLGQTATFSVTATGTGTMTYQWYKNGVPISGATSSTYRTPATVAGDNGSSFTVTVVNSAGSATSAPATLTVLLPPPVAKSLVPSSAAPPYNSSVQLFPSFSGATTAVIGSHGVGSSDITTSAVNGASYPTPPLTTTTTYTLTVTDSKGDVVSTTCVVTPTPVTLTPISPANQTVAPAQISFTTSASGGATNAVTWTASTGTFSANVWTPPMAAGTYTITATSVDEPSVFVTTTITLSAPVIMTQPANQHICTGSALTLSVTASYASSYQWSLNGTAIPGATNSIYTVSSAQSANAGNYSVTVMNGLGRATSSVATVAVGTISILANPTSLFLMPTQTGLFSVSGQGLGQISYQWYQIPSGGTTGVAISGATSSNYATPPVDTTYDGDQYYATVTDSCGTLTSTSATLTVTAGNAPPTILTQPVGQTVVPGGTASFTVLASGTPTLSYQWYMIPVGHTAGTAISGATSASYTVPSTATTTANDQDSYYVIVTNSYGQATSLPAPLVVGNGILLHITGQPVTQYVDVGTSATYQVTATSALPLTYQWYEAAPGTSTFTAIPGATGSSYTVPSASSSNNGAVFYVIVSNGVTASVTSSSAGLFVGPLSAIPNLCNTNWSALGDAVAAPSCSFQLTTATYDEHGEMVWPTLISTGDIEISFSVTFSNPSALPADGFTVLLADPSLGATTTNLGAVGMGLGAEGIPGLLFELDTYHNAGEPPVPYVAVTRGESALFEHPDFNVNTNIPAVVSSSMPITHSYTYSLVQGHMTVTMDGNQLFSGMVTPPPVAYLFITSSTGGSYEDTVVSNVSATISVPAN